MDRRLDAVVFLGLSLGRCQQLPDCRGAADDPTVVLALGILVYLEQAHLACRGGPVCSWHLCRLLFGRLSVGAFACLLCRPTTKLSLRADCASFAVGSLLSMFSIGTVEKVARLL